MKLGGGVSSEIMGGRFEDGFKVAFVTAAAAYAYNSIVNYEATWKSGGDATNKDSLDMPNSRDNNFGIAVRKPLDQRGFLEEGGWLSEQANNIPGMNSLAGLHDVFQVNLDVLQGSTDGWIRTVFNVPAMVPATVISYSALASEFVSPYLTIDNIRE